MKCARCQHPVRNWREFAEHALTAHDDPGPLERLEALTRAKEEQDDPGPRRQGT